jgi:peptidoglycan hydrolase CwlO-like protein
MAYKEGADAIEEHVKDVRNSLDIGGILDDIIKESESMDDQLREAERLADKQELEISDLEGKVEELKEEVENLKQKNDELEADLKRETRH